MNIEKTRQFYKDYDDLCDCAYCKNYIKEIRKAYLDLAEYLDKLGVDILNIWEPSILLLEIRMILEK